MSFDPEGPLAQQLKKSLVVELSSKYNIPDDASDVAEFIVVLIVSNKTAGEICAEVKDLVNIPIDEAFVNTVFAEIQRLIEESQQSDQVSQNAPQNDNTGNAVMPNMFVEAEPLFQNNNTAFPPPAAAFPEPAPFQSAFQPFQPSENAEKAPSHDALAKPTGPRALQKNRDFVLGPKGPRGIGKGAKNAPPKKSFALQNAGNFQKAMHASNTPGFVQRQPKGRCKEFPYCHNRECQFSHPTKVCFAYPKCPNPPGTCNYLHPSEDEALMAELEKTKEEYLRNKKPVEKAGTLGLCKFGILCSKELCPFGHPTPANHEAKVLDLLWCEAGKACTDPACRKGHPSPNYQAPASEPRSKFSASKPEKTLEQCKFGSSCTNYNCPRRHATTFVPCREGSNCQRLDCFFSHPIEEDCRFGASCKNKNCLFRHPEGREVPANTWSKDNSWTKEGTNQRAFAVPDDQVMEQAMQES